MRIPDDVLKSWEMDRDDANDSDESESSLEVPTGSDHMEVDHSGGVAKENRRKTRITASSGPSSTRRYSTRVVSGASAATSASVATSAGTKRRRSESPHSTESETDLSNTRRAKKRTKGWLFPPFSDSCILTLLHLAPKSPVVISISDDDGDTANATSSRSATLPRPTTRSSTAVDSKIPKLDRQLSDLVLGTYLNSAAIRRLAGSDSDE